MQLMNSETEEELKMSDSESGSTTSTIFYDCYNDVSISEDYCDSVDESVQINDDRAQSQGSTDAAVGEFHCMQQ